MMFDTNLESYVYAFSYLGILLWFAIIEQLTPIPEEVSLMSLGYLTVHTTLSPIASAITALVGLQLTDNALFYLGKKGHKIADKMLKKVNEDLKNRITRNLKEHAVLTLFVMAMIPKIRFVSPLISAVAGVSWKLFFAVNVFATALYVTFYMFVGFYFHQQIHRILKTLNVLQHGLVFFGLMLLAYFLIVYLIRRAGKAKNS